MVDCISSHEEAEDAELAQFLEVPANFTYNRLKINKLLLLMEKKLYAAQILKTKVETEYILDQTRR